MELYNIRHNPKNQQLGNCQRKEDPINISQAMHDKRTHSHTHTHSAEHTEYLILFITPFLRSLRVDYDATHTFLLSRFLSRSRSRCCCCFRTVWGNFSLRLLFCCFHSTNSHDFDLFALVLVVIVVLSIPSTGRECVSFVSLPLVSPAIRSTDS